MSAMLRTRGLGLVVGQPPRWLVRALTLEVGPGSITAVVGPNGSGKSTLLRALCGLEPPHAGEVRLRDQHLAAWPARERAKQIAYLPQSTPLVHDMKARQIVALGRAPYRHRLQLGGHAEDPAVAAALASVSATALARRQVSTLSGGERQRVMIARMLATGAACLVLDEPTAALDIGHALALHQLLRSLADDGRCVVIAMHDLGAARALADQALCLGRRDEGGTHYVGPTAAVLDPGVLGPVFGVGVRLHDGMLQFSTDSND